MKINQLAYHYKVWGWQLKPVTFHPLNLLVGASSAGKTQIIRAISDLRQIANGGTLSGVAWELEFETQGGQYRWTGETENLGLAQNFVSDIYEPQQQPKIIQERLFAGTQKLVERNESHIKFRGVDLPVKLPSRISVINLLREDPHVAPVHHGFNKIILKMEQVSQLTTPESEFSRFDLTAEQYRTLTGIQKSELPIQLKLALLYRNVPEVFAEIRERFIEIFPHVADIKMEILQQELNVVPYLCLRENGMSQWMPSSRISSGMIKSLIFIANLYLCDEGTVLLIDEFENGLGVNCIDILDDMLLEDRDLQFIITTHHPYIINNVPMLYWKIVTRKGDVVTVRTADELKLGQSKHEAFMQLLQLEEYTEGISPEDNAG